MNDLENINSEDDALKPYQFLCIGGIKDGEFISLICNQGSIRFPYPDSFQVENYVRRTLYLDHVKFEVMVVDGMSGDDAFLRFKERRNVVKNILNNS